MKLKVIIFILPFVVSGCGNKEVVPTFAMRCAELVGDYYGLDRNRPVLRDSDYIAIGNEGIFVVAALAPKIQRQYVAEKKSDEFPKYIETSNWTTKDGKTLLKGPAEVFMWSLNLNMTQKDYNQGLPEIVRWRKDNSFLGIDNAGAFRCVKIDIGEGVALYESALKRFPSDSISLVEIKIKYAIKPAPAPAAVVEQASTSPTSNQLNVQCAATKDCVSAMLNSARSENFDAALEVAKQVDTLNKPARGDRKQARKLNDEGLEALRQSNYKEAIDKFRSAKEIDSVDEEIVGNLTLALIESKNYKEAEVVAYDGVLLNPRRANFWWLIAIIKQKQGMPKEALQSLWLSMQFTKDKPRLLGIIEKKAGEEKDDQLRSMYSEAMSWLGSGQKPKF